MKIYEGLVGARGPTCRSTRRMRMLAGIGILFTMPLVARNVTDLSGDAWQIDGTPGTVPHTWNATDGADGLGDPRQVPSSADSYERKRVRYCRPLPDPKPGQRQFVRCEGASIRAEVRVNGEAVGTHVGAFTAFVFDVTEKMRASSNVLEIAVDNFVDTNVPPVSADFTVYGGLYRKVELIETDALRFDSTPDGGPGIVIEAEAATGRVRVIPRVAGGKNPQFAIRVEGPGLDRPIIAKGLELKVPKPCLWTPETPHVYTLTAVVAEDAMKDKIRLDFGFRTVMFGKDGRFYLNGVPRKIRGVNYHQDREGKGWAVSAADQEADIAMIKAMGADGIRTAHYPHAPHVYDLCDRQGLLAWLEMPNVNVLTATDAYRQNALTLLRETIAQHRHHPSVFVWSTSNEVKLIGDDRANRFATDLQKELDALARRLDPSRPTILATFKPEQRAFNAIPTALGYNFYPGWYRSSADKMRETVDEAVRQSPEHPTLAVSEYGAGSTPGQHETPDVRSVVRSDFHSEEYAATVHHQNYRTLAADDRVWGTFVWVMFDFASDTRREGGRYGLNDKGLVGFDHKTLKEPYYFYRANWKPEPMLHLVGEKMSVTTNATVRVMAFSTVGDVTLEVNGTRIGTQTPDETKTVIWDGVKLREGKNGIRLSAGDGRTVEATWDLARPVELGSPFADGMVLQRGRAVPVWGWAEPETKIAVSFGGKRVSTVADRTGKWRVNLPPMKASKEGRALKINARVVKDVLVGEVWFCSGQSNMELPLVSDNPRVRDRNGSLVAQMTYRPFIRFAHMKPGVKMTPQAKAAHPVVWKDFRPENLQTNVSALAVYYALELYGALDVPIGLVGVYRGGSRLEPWVPNEGFRSVPEMKAQADYVPVEKGFSKEALLALNPKIIKSHLSTIFQPSVHWNAVVEPWAPYACRGMIWYQGEANAAEGADYIPKLQALYNGWAERFENKDFSLYIVQLAPMASDTVLLQEAQQAFVEREPHAALAVITDIGNVHDIHPNEKEFAAKRLAVHALKRNYGFSRIKDDSPVFESVRFEGTNAVVRFRNAERLYIYNKDRSMTTGFELAGADGTWKPATVGNLKKSKWSNGNTFIPGTIDGSEIVLTAKGVAAPKAVRYLHAKPYTGNVYNEVDLPLGPFSRP